MLGKDYGGANNFKKGKVFRTDKERDQAISEFTKKTTIELT